MLIDWFTVGAQIVNFLILVVLLKKFLYGPVIQAMAAREARMKARLEEADSRRQAAAAEEAAAHQHLQEVEETRQALAVQAEAQVLEWKKGVLEEARQEVEQARQDWLQALGREKSVLGQSFKVRLGHQVLALARLILLELADASLEQRFLEVFRRRLRELKAEDRQAFQESLAESGGEAVIASAFDVGEADRSRIREAVQEQFGSRVNLRFETDPGVILGIELKTRGTKLSWAAEALLEKVEAKLGETFANLTSEAFHGR